MFDERERNVRKALRLLAKQRVAIILQPGNVWAVERAVPNDDATKAALSTCHMRGWAEPLGNAIPSGEIDKQGNFPPNFTKHTQMYRLTDSGWAVVNRAQLWTITSVFIAVVSLLFSLIAILFLHT